MKDIPQISESELEVMKILWQSGQATSSQIIDTLICMADWKPKTIQTFITRLAAKGAIKAEKTGSKAYIYTPIVSEGEFKSYANKSFLQKVYNGSLSLMLTSFIKERNISKEEIADLKKLLEEEM